MAVSFERIPANIRVPLFYAEISNSQASYFQLQQPALLIGPMLDSGIAVEFEPVLVTDANQAYGLFGAGSVLGDMVAEYRQNDTAGTLWCIPHKQTGTAANLTDTIDGTASASTVMAVYIGGDRYALPVAQGDTGPQIAANLASLINSNAFALVTAEAPVPDPGPPVATAGTLTYTAKGNGTVGNDIVRTWNWRGIAGGEMFPPGITVTGEGAAGLTANLKAGAGVPAIASVINSMGDDEYDFIGMPYTDTATLDAMQTEMNDVTGRWAWSRQIYGHVFTSKMGTPGTLQAFGVLRNDPHATVMGFASSPTVQWRHAAALCAQAASSLRIDPARPLQTLVLVGIQPPQRGARFKLTDNNTLLYSGIATEMESGGAVAIGRCITTYRVNAWNQPDPSWLDVQTPATLAYIIRFLRQRILQKFGRHKLADNGTPLGFGQATVTPNIIRAELIAAYSELENLGVAENMDAFKQYLIVERDANDPNRVNVLLPPDLVNQLRIFAMLVQFRLQSAPPSQAAA